MKYKIDFYSPLLNRRMVKVVENPNQYTDAVILEVIDEKPQFDFEKELFDFLTRQNRVMIQILVGGAINENNK